MSEAAPADSAREDAPKRRSPLWRAARVAVTLLCAGAIAWSVDAAALGRALATAQLPLVAAGCALYAAAAVFMAWRWRAMLRVDGTEVSLGLAARTYFESFFYGLALPSALGGDLYRGAVIAARQGGVRRTTVNLAAERVLGLQGLCALALFGALWGHALPTALARTVVGVAAAAFVACSIPFVPGVARPFVAAARRLGLARAADLLAAISEQVGAYARNPAVLVQLALATLAQQLLSVVALWLFDLALDAGAGLPLLLMTAPVTWFLGVVPAVGGFGPREGGLAFLLSSAGVALERATAIAVLGALAIVVRAAVGGVLLLFRR